MFVRQAKIPVDFNTQEDYKPEEKLEQHLASHQPSADAVAMHRKTIKESVKKMSRKHKRN